MRMQGGGMDEAERRAARDALEALAGGDLGVLAPDVAIDASHPWGRLRGDPAPWEALRRALPDLERRDAIFLAGANAPDARWTDLRPSRLVACLGSYVGTFREPLAGIPPTGGVAALDYGEAHWIEGGRVRASWLVWDLAGLMIRTGAWPMAAPLGAPGFWPAPRTQDGLRMAPAPGEDGAALVEVLAMHRGLDTFRGRDVAEIDMGHWADGFTYWAGGAIGAARGVEGFRAHHQIPYRRAFPGAEGLGHFVRLSDGPYAATGGDVGLRHTGGEYLGIAATGRSLRFRVMDFYRMDAAERIAENWLPNDTLGLMAQMGVDVLARLAHRRGAPRRTL
ncbi:ester cyclase [Jannaschia sp. W003]|uniref:nuclear transport factor 2 family protein n=1 Tax=Jannaschia sp. W003 TaxID=2867012 RepID=UPI0021A32649|nr:ester cyclase [Jannaschia sp. W003]UWQ21149.1 ester cyclase [Jannaschia sp. W003]